MVGERSQQNTQKPNNNKAPSEPQKQISRREISLTNEKQAKAKSISTKTLTGFNRGTDYLLRFHIKRKPHVHLVDSLHSVVKNISHIYRYIYWNLLPTFASLALCRPKQFGVPQNLNVYAVGEKETALFISFVCLSSQQPLEWITRRQPILSLSQKKGKEPTLLSGVGLRES